MGNAAFTYLRCNQCEYEEGCSLREIAPELEGCAGHRHLHSRYAEMRSKEEREAWEKRQQALILSEDRLQELKQGDKVRLIGSTISLGLHLPRYLDNGTFKVLGVTRTGRLICDWDGGKPFNIPPSCLEKLNE